MSRREKIRKWYEEILRLPDHGARIVWHGSWHEQDATLLWNRVEELRAKEEKEPNGR